MIINKGAPAAPALPGGQPGIILGSKEAVWQRRELWYMPSARRAPADVSFIPPEKMREKFIGNPKEVDILCPMCGTKTTGKAKEEK